MYPLVEDTVDQEEEDALQASGDCEDIRHDSSRGANLQQAQEPSTPQDEELCCGLERQHPGGFRGQRGHGQLWAQSGLP